MQPLGKPPSRPGRRWSSLVFAALVFALTLPAPTTVAAAESSVTPGVEPLSPDGEAFGEPGPYRVQAREVVVARTEEDGGDFDARLFIPLAPEGPDASSPGPVVAFGHGYLAPVGLYESTLAHLASWGITTIAPRSGGELLPDHAEFAADLAAAIEWVVTDAASAEDWPGLAVDADARGVSGHSMGGGAAVLAAALDERVATVATLAAADTRPSAIEAAARLDVPALFVAGADDGITPVDEHQRPMFEATRGIPSQLRSIIGGSHCGFLDEAILAGLICDRAGIDAADQLAAAKAALTAWFRSELADDPAAQGLAWPLDPLEDVTIETRGTTR